LPATGNRLCGVDHAAGVFSVGERTTQCAVAINRRINRQRRADLQGLRQAKRGKAARALFADAILAERGDHLPALPRRNLNPAAQLAGIERFAIGDFIGADQPHILRDRIARANPVAGGQIDAFRLAQRHGSAGGQFQLVIEQALCRARFEHG